MQQNQRQAEAAKYREAFVELQKQFQFGIHDVEATDIYYNDGDSRILQSYFKLIFSHANDKISSIVFIYPHGWCVSWGSLTDKESLAIHDLIDSLSNASQSSR